MRPRLRLPLRFDPDKMLAEVARIEPSEWIPHFNKDEYSGRWDGVALLAPGGDSSKLYPGASDPAAYSRTPVLDRCPYLGEVLDTLKCRVLSARLLRLAPGARIHEHRDYDLGPDTGRVRLHVPIQTGADVRFMVGGRRVVMAPGDTWYMDFGLMHRVDNDGTIDRIHLVVDCLYEEWLQILLMKADEVEPPEGPVTESGLLPPVEVFRRLGIFDSALAASLHACPDANEFATVAEREALARGLRVPSQEVHLVLRGTNRGGAVLEIDEAPPLDDWIPESVQWDGQNARVRWCLLGRRPLAEPFFDDSLKQVRRSPGNRFLAPTTSFEALERAVSARPGLPLIGIIAHVSRCGSTLAAQMLGSLPSLVVASEPPPLDQILRGGDLESPRAIRIARTRAIVKALGRPRTGGEKGFVLKLDSWHLASMDLLREAFPRVPIAIVYRDPVFVLASHMRSPGLQMAGGLGPPFDVPMAGQSQLEYRARITGLLFQAALRACSGTLLVHYEELPLAATTKIASHFGLQLTEGDERRMGARGTCEAKDSGRRPFDHDAKAAKSASVTDDIKRCAERYAGSAYRELEGLRTRTR